MRGVRRVPRVGHAAAGRQHEPARPRARVHRLVQRGPAHGDHLGGMFSKPPDPTDVIVMGVLDDGRRIELSHTDAQRRDWFGRITDVRLRKIQNRLATPEERSAWGKQYLAYFCRAGAPARDA